MRGGGVGWEGDEAAPEGALGEGAHGEAGYDAEVVEAAFEGAEERGVGGAVCVDDGAGGEDDLGGVSEWRLRGGEGRDTSKFKMLSQTKP